MVLISGKGVGNIVKVIAEVSDNRKRCTVLGFWRTFSEQPKKLDTPSSTQEPSEMSTTSQDKDLLIFENIRKGFLTESAPKRWNERSAVNKARKSNSITKRVNSMTTYLRELQSFRNIPQNLPEIAHYFEQKHINRQILEQQFLPERVYVLKGELAAAHFIIGRGGSVKFRGNTLWVGRKEAYQILPVSYVPGYEVESINAEHTGLRKEGLQNLAYVNNLKWLSLKGLDTVDDWFLDLISNTHKNLEYLDISQCKNVTFRGLSCFYRFSCLKVLKVEDVSDTPEFKVACLMLLDIMPTLEILGINLTIPDKVEEVKVEQLDAPTNTQNLVKV